MPTEIPPAFFMEKYSKGGTYNFTCLDCHSADPYFTYTANKNEIKVRPHPYYPEEIQGYIQCPYCGGVAIVSGTPSPAAIMSGLGGVQARKINSISSPEEQTKAQEQLINERKKEIATSGTARRYYKTQHDRAMKNKAEWVRRGRKPEERSEAIKG